MGSDAASQLAERLRHIRWLGGGSGAGKTTIARMLAAEHGLQLYSCDATIAAHASRLTLDEAPLLHAFLSMGMDERWVNRAPEAMLNTFPWFAGEGFGLIVADLLALPPEPPIIAEGFRLLPRLVAPLLSLPRQAVWLAPTPAFRAIAFQQRGFTWEIPSKTSQPQRALANLLRRDQLFTDKLTAEVTALRLEVVKIDGHHDIGAVSARVAYALGLRTD